MAERLQGAEGGRDGVPGHAVSHRPEQPLQDQAVRRGRLASIPAQRRQERSDACPVRLRAIQRRRRGGQDDAGPTGWWLRTGVSCLVAPLGARLMPPPEPGPGEPEHLALWVLLQRLQETAHLLAAYGPLLVRSRSPFFASRSWVVVRITSSAAQATKLSVICRYQALHFRTSY
jgi:hypothetical protein